ncbi:hypothetical protein OJAV_G00204460 [Oryzias javanicus]|uniref:Uncharacterized protein n=1 Tax=Oryzias javanicus TaxID=123683 RepID=A0A3S2NW46_ORYJA|nr:hypothetical protein OJAV_G00204460 [Oryzias javanicus]
MSRGLVRVPSVDGRSSARAGCCRGSGTSRRKDMVGTIEEEPAAGLPVHWLAGHRLLLSAPSFFLLFLLLSLLCSTSIATMDRDTLTALL